ncbi:hypothetical protein OAN307_c26520 [Octadecabacter antarcticus 307]|uniref:DUF6671 domain-containing protein n=1 Tax=Octadecabacter antarcticus 307 TaxID=391626 RepID=M9REK1_9RHOB|nr:hypothetical protein OAN307_c26520 [Octadecabacter antarcticus 307]
MLSSMHGKEQAIGPVFLANLNLIVTPANGIDTDALGTFSGEIPRCGTMLEVAVAKARIGMDISGLPFGIASEGSFGPHPLFPIMPGGFELMVFVDDERGTVIHESLVIDDTNFAHLVTAPKDSISKFLSQVGFPSHGLMVCPNLGNSAAAIVKGIVDLPSVESAIAGAAALSGDGRARVETDMRAHLNPTRMKNLSGLATRLSDRLLHGCPSCAAPGWGRVKMIRGLPCEICDTTTESVMLEVFGCVACPHHEERPRADGLIQAESVHCPACNP